MSRKLVEENSDALKDEVRRRLSTMNPAYRIEELIRLQDALAHSAIRDRDTILTYWLKSDDKRRGYVRTNSSSPVD